MTQSSGPADDTSLETRLERVSSGLDALGERIDELQALVNRRARWAVLSVALKAVGLFAILWAATWVLVHLAAR
jgi:hypothetical protein